MSIPLRLVNDQSIDFEPEVTADDIAVMDLLLIEDCINRLRQRGSDLPQERIGEFVSAGERLSTLAKESLA